jgi:hypothetical protein
MKITRRQLKQLIKEEISRLNEAEEEFIKMTNVGKKNKDITWDMIWDAIGDSKHVRQTFDANSIYKPYPNGNFVVEKLSDLGGNEIHHSDEGIKELKAIMISNGFNTDNFKKFNGTKLLHAKVNGVEYVVIADRG